MIGKVGVDIQLVLFEGIACAELSVERPIVAWWCVAEVDVGLVGDATPVVIAHVKRIEDGADAHRALVVLAEVARQMFHHVPANEVPAYLFPPIRGLVKRVGGLLRCLLALHRVAGILLLLVIL